MWHFTQLMFQCPQLKSSVYAPLSRVASVESRLQQIVELQGLRLFLDRCLQADPPAALALSTASSGDSFLLKCCFMNLDISWSVVVLIWRCSSVVRGLWYRFGPQNHQEAKPNQALPNQSQQTAVQLSGCAETASGHVFMSLVSESAARWVVEPCMCSWGL